MMEWWSNSVQHAPSFVLSSESTYLYLIYSKSDNHTTQGIRIPLNIKLIYCKLVYSVINGIKLKFVAMLSGV